MEECSIEEAQWLINWDSTDHAPKCDWSRLIDGFIDSGDHYRTIRMQRLPDARRVYSGIASCISKHYRTDGIYITREGHRLALRKLDTFDGYMEGGEL